MKAASRCWNAMTEVSKAVYAEKAAQQPPPRSQVVARRSSTSPSRGGSVCGGVSSQAASSSEYSTQIKFGCYTVVQGQSAVGEGSYGQAIEVEHGSGKRMLMKLFRGQDDCHSEIVAYGRIAKAKGEAANGEACPFNGAACPFLDILSVWTVPPFMWIILPIVPGGNLTTQLRARSFQMQEIVAIMHGSWRGLRFLHKSAGILHLDIKLANMMWTHERVVILDFSLWERWPVPAAGKLHGTYCTDGFRPPELMGKLPAQPTSASQELLRRVVCPAVDWWSLGCVGGYLARGQDPPTRRVAMRPESWLWVDEKKKLLDRIAPSGSILRPVLEMLLHTSPHKRLLQEDDPQEPFEQMRRRASGDIGGHSATTADSRGSVECIEVV